MIVSVQPRFWNITSTKLTKCLTDGQFFLTDLTSLLVELTSCQNLPKHSVAMRSLADLLISCNFQTSSSSLCTMSAIGINGFGRIGRLVLRLIPSSFNFQIQTSISGRPLPKEPRWSLSTTPSSPSTTWSTCSSMTQPTASTRGRSRLRMESWSLTAR